MTSTEHSNDGRTMMAAVLFADLVGYSKKPVTDQMLAKEAFRDFLQSALAPLSPGSRVIVDTGDGAAVAFLADPEHALYVALRLRRDVHEGVGRGLLRSEDLRLGVNLGPVRRTVDVNGRPNLVGDGMNSAERVMSFSTPGETTVSRSFRDAVSCLHESYEQLFEPMGQRADKHGRQHEVFRMGALQQALEAATASLAPDPLAGAGQGPESGGAAPAVTHESHRPPLERRGLFAIAATAIALVGIGVAAWTLRVPRDLPQEETQSARAAAPATLPGPPPAPAAANASQPASSETAVPADEPAKAHTESGSSADPIESQAVAPREEPRPAAAVPATRSREPAKFPKAAHPTPGTAASPRCTTLLQRAALGEQLTAREQEEMRTCN
jgi:class 3 adenylate cyclase